MSKTVAVLVDGGFAKVKIHEVKRFWPTASNMVYFAKKCLIKNEELFRIYYYDCNPYSGIQSNPISKNKIDFSKTFVANRQFLSNLARQDNVALRLGELSYNGWKISRSTTVSMVRHGKTVGLTENDIEPDFEQKGVDIKIGLDIAWLASKHIVNRIILITGDSDFIPAMKFARKEGVQVVFIPLRHHVKKELIHHSDFVRDIDINSILKGNCARRPPTP